MWRTATARATGALLRSPSQSITRTPFRHYSSGSSNPSPSTVVNSMILRSLKEHYTEVSKMAPPPVRNPIYISLSLGFHQGLSCIHIFYVNLVNYSLRHFVEHLVGSIVTNTFLKFYAGF